MAPNSLTGGNFPYCSVPHHINQTPEQAARDRIDERLQASGWHVQDTDAMDFSAGHGIAEAKPDHLGIRLTSVEEQSEGYTKARLKWVRNDEPPPPFLYESTGQMTRFTNRRDPKPRSREVFTFHRPQTLSAWASAANSLRAGLAALPPLNRDGLRDCQVTAITNLEASLKADKPCALVRMATGSGKTFTAITQIYRLLKHARASRILFLVDTRNLGEQAEQEFMAFHPQRRQPQVHRVL